MARRATKRRKAAAAPRVDRKHVDTLGGVLCAICSESIDPSRLLGPVSAEYPCYNCATENRHCHCHSY